MTEGDLRKLMFGDYMNVDLDPDERVYEEVTSIEAMYTVTEQSLIEYNNQSKTRMNLVVFGWVHSQNIIELNRTLLVFHVGHHHMSVSRSRTLAVTVAFIYENF